MSTSSNATTLTNASFDDDPSRVSVFPMMSSGLPPPPLMRSASARRSSQDEIRALLQRTTNALDKIVKIRESMEPFVDFSQFEKKSSSARVSQTLSSTRSRPSLRVSGGSDDTPLAETSRGSSQRRMDPADSYVSTDASDDALGDRSTGSTDTASSVEEESDSLRSQPIVEEADGGRDNNTVVGPRPAAFTETSEADAEEDDNDSTFSSVDELPPTKEARLERLKNITVEFHEGLPTEFYMALARFLHSSVELKTRHSRFNFYKDTFIGSDAVRDMILSGFAEDMPTAVRFGNVLVKLGYIEHVSRTDDQLHNNKDNFYRFTKALHYEEHELLANEVNARPSINAANYRESMLSRESVGNIEYDFSEASDEVHALATEESLVILARVLHKVFERKNKLLFYKGFVGCFLGAEAVKVIRELSITSSLIDAVLVGQALLDEKLIEPIAATVTTFQDKYVFYRLTRAQS
ncbi:hypothetical protein ATCC90586_003482 [Pythium insidiosum]|nr:hypothetical protein ATCC90586_003482 [Pythium insidiosum]